MRVQAGGDRVRGERRSRIGRARIGGALYPAAWKALAVLVLAGALLLFVPSALQRTETSVVGNAHLLRWFSDAVAGNDPTEWGESFSWTEAYGHALPEGFASEVLALEGVDVTVSDQGPVVGYRAEGDPETSMAKVRDELAGKGWIAVESGTAALQTFVKESGRYRWASVSCTHVGGATSVVVTVKGETIDE